MQKNFNENDIFGKTLDNIADKLIKGEVIIYPTDTVYGIGAIPFLTKSIKSIYNIKNRSLNSPLIALISDIKYLEKIAFIPENKRILVNKLISNFWPGALTIILNKKSEISEIMTSGKNTIGIRMPNLDISLKIIESAGGILATTSANISGKATPKSFEEVSYEIKERVNIIVETKKQLLGIESTIIDITSNPKILRIGAISKNKIEKVIGKIE